MSDGRPALSRVAWGQRALLAGSVAIALAGSLALWPSAPEAAVLWALQTLVGWWMGVLALQMTLAQQANRAAWRARTATDTPAPLPPAPWPRAVRAWLWSCLAAPRVFFWRQPFAEWRWPDRLDFPPHAAAPRAVLFVHGLVANRGFWNPWLRTLTAEGAPFMALSLREPFALLDVQARELTQAVDRIVAATGRPPLIVAHSMGGLVVRAWLRHEAQAGHDWRERVHRVALIGSPLAGTDLANWAVGPLGRQMRRAQAGGCWIAQLNADLDRLGVPRSLFACWASDCDNMVFPAHTALLEGSMAHVLLGVPHVPLATHPAVQRAVLALRHAAPCR